MSSTLSLERLVEAIRRLTPEERRTLLRLLQVNGLLEPPERLTDVDPLRIAPAVSTHTVRRLSQPTRAQADTGLEGSEAPSPSAPEATEAPPTEAEAPATDEAPSPEPVHIRITFDGGSKGNPGQGYGSYAVEWPDEPRQVVRLRFGDLMTNNEAEYETLIASLEDVLQQLEERGIDPATATVEIWGDSQLVVKQVAGEWRCREPRLQIRRDQVRELMDRFGEAHLHHHGREHSVEVLGH